jgi:hypothetical protein
MKMFEQYFVITIIVWRITHLISSEDGPFDIIIRFRKLLGESFWGKLMDCFYCLSIWIGLLCACVEANGIREGIILTLYYSGSAILLEKLTDKTPS